MQVRVFRRLLGLTSITGLVICQSMPGFAWTPLISGLAVEKKLNAAEASPGRQDFYDPPNSPVIIDIAEFLTQYLPEHGFFFMGDQYTGHAGVDLRTLLLKQSTPIKLPDNLEGEGLGLPTEEEPSIEAPSLSPKIKAAAKQVHGNDNANDGELKLVAPNFRAATAPGFKENKNPKEDLAVDATPLLSADASQRDAKASAKQVHSPLLASSFKASLAPELAPQLAAFLLWTLPMAGESKFALPPFNMDFAGTFVECEFGTRFKSITARNLTLSMGRLLVSVVGSPVVVSTDLGDVTVPPSTAAIIEHTDKGILKVTSLLASADGAVSFKLINANGRAETISLKDKQELIVANSELSADDISALSNLNKFNVGDRHLVKGNVDTQALAKQDILFSSLKDEQKIPVLTELQARINTSSQATQELTK